MAIEVTNYRIPIEFEMSDELVTDSRFKKVKIWIAHTGENLNNSFFTKEMLEKLATTLPYVPIVGFIEENPDGEEDYSDHRQSLQIKEGKIKLEYQGKAYGFIPEEPNAKLEIRNGKEWLTAEGYMWTKFTTALDILAKGGGVKSQSMEIQDVDGEVDELGRLVFSEGRFDALCILGDHVTPGMTGSTIQVFNKSDIKESIKEMIREFSLQNKEGRTIPTKKETSKEFEEEVKKNQQDETDEAEVDKQDEQEEETEEEVETESDTDSADDEETFESKKDEEEKETKSDDEEKEDKKEAKFELSHDQVRSSIRDLAQSTYADSNKDVWVTEMYDNHAIYEVYDYEDGSMTYMDVKYEKVEGSVVLGEAVEVQSMFVTNEEAASIEQNRTRVAELEKELAGLKEFKAQAEKAEKEAILAEFEAKLPKETLDKLRTQFTELNASEIEKEAAYAYFQFTKEESQMHENNVALAVDFDKNEAKGRYGSLARHFTK